MNRTRVLACSLAVQIAFVSPVLAAAVADAPTSEPRTTTPVLLLAQARTPKSAKAPAIVYVPPLRGAPATRVGGSTRGADDAQHYLAVLAPEDTGLTLRERPTLYWYLSKPVLEGTLELTLIDEDGTEPLLEVNLGPPIDAGLKRLPLSEHGLALKRDAEYRWSVALIWDPNQRSKDIVASGTIRRIETGADVAAKLQQADKIALPTIYAREGIWYDAIDALSNLIDDSPGDPRLRELRARLLDQVGLSDVAASDRQED